MTAKTTTNIFSKKEIHNAFLDHRAARLSSLAWPDAGLISTPIVQTNVWGGIWHNTREKWMGGLKVTLRWTRWVFLAILIVFTPWLTAKPSAVPQTNVSEYETLPYQTVPLTETDFETAKTNLILPTQTTFNADKPATLKIFQAGFTLVPEKLPIGFSPGLPVAVQSVEVVGPYNQTEGFRQYQEQVFSADKKINELHLVQDKNFQPGVYTIRTTLTNGQQTTVEENTFAWGVLVVNPEKSIYRPGEQVNLGMAVLDKTGVTLCQADLKLTVTDPSGQIITFNTTDGSITRSYDCDIHSVTNVPDYAASFTAGEVGTYQLELESTIQRGQEKTAVDQAYSITDSFEVRASVPYDVSRKNTPVRIYPVADYPANFTITANQDWNGPVSEFVPADFSIYDISDGGTIVPSEDGFRQEIIWNVDWRAGQTHTLSYQFDAADISPALYPLGPLTIGGFQEARQWQIASDATKTWDGGGGASALWSTCTNWDADACPANTGDSVQFNGTSNNNSDWDAGSGVTSISAFTVTSMSGSITFTKTPVTVTGNFSHASTGNVIFAGSASISFARDFTLTTSGTFTPNTSTLAMTTGGASFNSAKSFYNLTINPSLTGTINIVTNSPTVTGTLNIAAGDTMAIASGISVTHTGATLTWGSSSSTISGAGTLRFTNASGGPGTGGVLSSTVRYDTSGGATAATTIDARTYSGRVEIYSNSGTARTVTLASGAYILSGVSSHLYLIADGTANVTLTGVTNGPSFTIDGDVDFTGAGAGSEVLRTGAGAWSVAGNVDVRDGSLVIPANNVFTLTGAGKSIWANSNTFYDLTIDPASAGTITINDGLAVTNALVISSDATVTFNDSNAYIDGMATFTLDGTLDGPGTLYYYDATGNFPTTGNVACLVFFYLSGGDLTVPGRTFGGDVVVQEDSTSSYSLFLGSAGGQTLTVDGYLNIDALNTGNITVDAATYDPIINIGGNLDFVGTNPTGIEVITAGTCPWTVSGNVNFTDGTYTRETGTCNGSGSGSTLVMDGTGTLTTDSEVLQNLTLSGAVTLASATHTVAGSLDLTGSTLTPGTSVISMTGTGSLAGGSKTLYGLTVNGNADTVTVTSSLTVSNVLTLGAAADGNNDTLTINSGQTLTLSANSGTSLDIKNSGTDTINGPGRLTYQNSATTFPTVGTLAAALIVRFDTLNGDMALPVRADYGAIEAYGGSANARVITIGGNITTSGYFYVMAEAAATKNVTVSGTANNPAVTIGGDLDFTGAGAATEVIQTGTNTWTVGGNVNFTDGTFTATNSPSLNTLKMNGTSKNLTCAGQTIQNFEVSGGSISAADAVDVNGTFRVSAGEFAQAAAANLNIAGDFTLDAGATFTAASGAGKVIFDGDLTFNDATDPPQNIGAVEIGTSPDTVDLASDLTSGKSLTVAAGDILNTNGYDIDTGTVTVNGTLDATDDVETDETFINCSGSFAINSTATYVADQSTLIMDAASGTKTLVTDGAFSLYNLTISDGGGSLLVQVQDPLDVDNNLAITGGNLDTVSGESNSINVGGNWDNDDTFTARSGIVTMDAGSGAPTIDADGTGADAFFSLTFNDGGGSAVYELSTAMDVDNNLTITGGNFDANGNNLTIGGNWDNDDTFTSGTQTTTFDAASGTKTIDGDGTGTEAFSSVVFNDSAGGATWQLTTLMNVDADLTITGGTLDFNGSNTLYVGGNFTNNDTMVQSTGTLQMDGASGTKYIDTTEAVSNTASDFNNITFNDGGGATTYKTKYPIDLDGNLAIMGGTLDMAGPTTWYLTNSDYNGVLNEDWFINNWRLKSVDPAGSADDTTVCSDGSVGRNNYCVFMPGQTSTTWGVIPTTIQNLGWMLNDGIPVNGTIAAGTWDVKATTIVTNGTAASYKHKYLYTRLWKANADLSSPTAITSWGNIEITAGTNDYTISFGGVSAQTLINQVLYVEFSTGFELQGFGAGTATTVAFRVNEGGAKQQITTPAFTPQVNLAGNWDNNDTFTHASGRVVFDAGTTGRTIEAGASPFYDVDVNNAAGGWTVQTDNMTVADNLALTAGTDWVVDSGRTLEVNGDYTQAIAAADTTWTGSTLYLNGLGGMYDINTKTHGGDTYATVRVGSSEDIAMWDSSASAYTMDAGGCLFSEDHGGTAGRLNVYGTCNSRSNEYWSYATDFDGAALAGSSRQANVQFDSGASLIVDSGDALAIRGQDASNNRSVVSRISAGNYGLTVNGTINAQYYDFDYLNDSGLNIGSTATVTELSDGNFDNAGAGVASSYITITSATSSKNFFNNVFDDNADGADANVVNNIKADGPAINWSMFNFSGNKSGEDYDVDTSGAFIGWIYSESLSLSANSINFGLLNPSILATGNHDISVSTSAQGGYSCYAQEDTELHNGAFDINDVVGGTVTTGTEAFGINCSGTDCDLVQDTAITTSPLTVASNNGPVTNSTTTIDYKVSVSSNTASGSYGNTVTYTCSGNF